MDHDKKDIRSIEYGEFEEIIQELSEKKEALEAELEEKTERWVYLNELNEKIQNQ